MLTFTGYCKINKETDHVSLLEVSLSDCNMSLTSFIQHDIMCHTRLFMRVENGQYSCFVILGLCLQKEFKSSSVALTIHFLLSLY